MLVTVSAAAIGAVGLDVGAVLVGVDVLVTMIMAVVVIMVVAAALLAVGVMVGMVVAGGCRGRWIQAAASISGIARRALVSAMPRLAVRRRTRSNRR